MSRDIAARLTHTHTPLLASAGKVVHAETTVAHAVLNGSQYYHQEWSHAAAHVIVPPLRIDPNTPGYLMGLLAKYVLDEAPLFIGIAPNAPYLPLTATPGDILFFPVTH